MVVATALVDEERISGNIPVEPGLIPADPAVPLSGRAEDIVEGKRRRIEVHLAQHCRLARLGDHDVVDDRGHGHADARTFYAVVVRDRIVDHLVAIAEGDAAATQARQIVGDQVPNDQRVRGIRDGDATAAPGRIAADHIAFDGQRCMAEHGDAASAKGIRQSVPGDDVLGDAGKRAAQEEDAPTPAPAAAARGLEVALDDVALDQGRATIGENARAFARLVGRDDVAGDGWRSAAHPDPAAVPGGGRAWSREPVTNGKPVEYRRGALARDERDHGPGVGAIENRLFGSLLARHGDSLAEKIYVLKIFSRRDEDGVARGSRGDGGLDGGDLARHLQHAGAGGCGKDHPCKESGQRLEDPHGTVTSRMLSL
jgi:hypothetical protein